MNRVPKALAVGTIFFAISPVLAGPNERACLGAHALDEGCVHTTRLVRRDKDTFRIYVASSKAQSSGMFKSVFGIYVFKPECPSLQKAMEKRPVPWNGTNEDAFDELSSLFVLWGEAPRSFSYVNYFHDIVTPVKITSMGTETFTWGDTILTFHKTTDKTFAPFFKFNPNVLYYGAQVDASVSNITSKQSQKCDVDAMLKLSDYLYDEVIATPMLAKAATYAKAGNVDGVKTNVVPAAGFAKDWWAASYWMARLYQMEADLPRARHYAARAVEQNPDNAEAKALYKQLQAAPVESENSAANRHP